MRPLIALLLALALASPCFAGLPEAKPEAVGFDASRLARVEDAIARAVGEKRVPGGGGGGWPSREGRAGQGFRSTRGRADGRADDS